MKLCSLTLDVAPHTSKIIKNGLKEERMFYKIVYYTLDKSIVRNETSKLEFL